MAAVSNKVDVDGDVRYADGDLDIVTISLFLFIFGSRQQVFPNYDALTNE